MLAILSLEQKIINVDTTVIPIKMQEDCLSFLTTLTKSQIKIIEKLYPVTAYFKAGTSQKIELIIHVGIAVEPEAFDRIYNAIKRCILLTLKETGNADQYKLVNLELSNDNSILQANMLEAKARLLAFLKKTKPQNDEEKKSPDIAFVIDNIEEIAEEEIALINEGLKLDKVHRTFKCWEGNPYGYDKQKYNHGVNSAETKIVLKNTKQNTFFSDGAVKAESFRENYEVTEINYPHPSNTVNALKDAAHALGFSNLLAFNNIVNLYPTELRIHFYSFAKKIRPGLNLVCPPAMVRPFTKEEAVIGDAHRSRRSGYHSI
jgi:hypothetical protein